MTGKITNIQRKSSSSFMIIAEDPEGKIFIADEFTSEEPHATYYKEIIEGKHGAIGDYDDYYPKKFTKIYNLIEAEKPKVSSLSMARLRAGLIDMGLIQKVVDGINALPSPIKEKALVVWEYAPEVPIESYLAQTIKTIIDFTDEEFAEFYVTASQARHF